MLILQTNKGYFRANNTNGAFDVKLTEYREDSEDFILKF